MDPEPMKSFDEQFKAWARRPPSISSPVASRQVLRRLASQEEPRPRRVRWGPGVAAAALGGILATGFLAVVNLPLFDDSKGPESVMGDPAAVVSHLETAPVPEGVAVIWLDPATPLYLTVDAPDVPEGDSAP